MPPANNSTTKWNPMFHLAGINSNKNDIATTHGPNTTDRLFFKVMSVIQITEISTALIINLLLCIVFLNQKKLRRKTAYRFFINLQIVHFLLLMSNIIQKCYSNYSAIHIYVNNGLLMELFSALFLTTMDRLITIKYPYKYAQVQLSQITVIICCSWLPGLIFVFGSILTRVSQEIMTITNIILIGFATIVLVSSNSIIHAIARRHWAVINGRSVQASSNLSAERKRLKSTYVCHAIVLSFLVFWLPYFFHDILLLKNKPVKLNRELTACVEVLSVANSITNPIFFVLFRKDAKKELRRLLKRVRARPSNTVLDSKVIKNSSDLNCFRVSVKIDKGSSDQSNNVTVEQINMTGTGENGEANSTSSLANLKISNNISEGGRSGSATSEANTTDSNGNLTAPDGDDLKVAVATVFNEQIDVQIAASVC